MMRVPGSQSVLHMAQVLAIAGAAVWAVWLYVDGGRELSKLEKESRSQAIKAQLLTNAQIKDLADVERDSKRISLEQQKLTYRQQLLLSDTEKQSKELGLRQQRLAYQQASLSQDATLAQLKYSAEIAGLDARGKAVEVRNAEGGRVDLQYSLKITCVSSESSKYLAVFDLKLTNISEVPVELSWRYVRIFYGSPVEGLMKEPGEILTLGGLPGLMDDPSESPIKWVERHRWGAVQPDAFARDSDRLGKNIFPGGPGLGIVRKGNWTGNTMRFVVSGKPGDLFGLVYFYMFDGYAIDEYGGSFRLSSFSPEILKREPDERFYYVSASELLPSCERGATPATS